MIDHDFKELVRRLQSALGAQFPATQLARIDGFLRILSGAESPTFADEQSPRVPNLFMPGLVSRPFLDLDTAELRGLEAAVDDIRSELDDLLAADQRNFRPYGAEGLDDEDPSLTKGWDVFYLYKDFQPLPEALQRCPKTMAALEHYPVALEAYFSILRPGARIPRHTDPSNFVLATHLAMYVPENCGITVAKESRTWREGKCLLLDTSFWHQAWNDGDRWRVTLNIDTWHPDLTPVERQAFGFLGEQLLPHIKPYLKA